MRICGGDELQLRGLLWRVQQGSSSLDTEVGMTCYPLLVVVTSRLFAGGDLSLRAAPYLKVMCMALALQWLSNVAVLQL